VGFVGNINYAQMIDLAAGFVGLDPAGDDGYRYGLWPGQTELKVSSYAGELRKNFFDLPSTPPAGAKAPSRGGCYVGRGRLPMPPVAGAAAPARKEETKKEEPKKP
jgi:hypothetical protein